MTIKMPNLAREMAKIESLVGYTIIGPCHSGNGDYFGIVLRKGAYQKVAWIDRDEEGNGIGYITLEDDHSL